MPVHVTFKLVGILEDYYPDAAAGHGAGPVDHAVAPATTARTFLDGVGIPDEQEYFIMINEALVEPGAAATRALEDGDDIVLVPVIKGG